MIKLLLFSSVTLFFVSCKSSENVYNNKEILTIEEIEEGRAHELEEVALRKVGDFIEYDFQVRDQEDILYSVDSPKDFISKVEHFQDGSWKALSDLDISDSKTNSCTPTDYCILMDQSGSMTKARTAIFRQVDKFIDHKNDFDHVAIIKYTYNPVIACGYLADKSELVKELFNKDSLIGASDQTAHAYQAYLDSLKMSHPNKKHEVIIFSDLSGVLPLEELREMIKLNYEDSVETHQILYSKGLFNKWFARRHKDVLNEMIYSGYGEVYRVDEYSEVSKYLNTIIDENCLSNTLKLPVLQVGENKYRITTHAGDNKVETEVIYVYDPPPKIENESFDYEYDVANLLNINFNSGSDSLEAESQVELDKVYRFLEKNPNIKIELQGHTDNQGGYQFNLDLSQDRADAVRNHLIHLGIPEERIKAVGYAYLKPIASNETSEGRRQNRRTEFVILR